MSDDSPLRAAPKGGWLLAVKVRPGASRTGLDGVTNGRIVVRLQAPPVDGKANAALVAFLAGRLGLSKSRLSLVRGEAAREKLIHIDAESVDASLLMGELK